MTASNPWHRHAAINRMQTVLLIAVLLALCALAGWALFGETGFWIALATGVFALFFQPVAMWRLTLAMYRARPIAPQEAPGLWRQLAILAQRAGLPEPPALYYVPSAVVNAFAVGNRRHAAVALTDGVLRTMSPRELAGVLAHEIAHIAHDDLRVMGLADYVSRLTALFALAGQLLLLVALPLWWIGKVDIHWLGVLLLIFSPQLAMLAQLGLSRVREFDADLAAARLTGDPQGLAQALAKIERVSRAWRGWLFPGWGNPEPSWLRTHPPTEERVARLMELHFSPAFGHKEDAPGRIQWAAHVSPPRWRVYGVWR